MDLAAVLARRPEVALVDELAHTNVPDAAATASAGKTSTTCWTPGSTSSRRSTSSTSSRSTTWSHKITGVPQRETVPDVVVRRADQIELVDMTPEALRRRMAHGNVYAADKVDAALSNYFRPGNLAALRELALLWLADRVDAGLQATVQQHDIAGDLGGARTRGGRPHRRPRGRHADPACGPHRRPVLRWGPARGPRQPVRRPHRRRSRRRLAQQRQLAEDLGGSYHQIVGDDVPDALLSFARAENATQLVLGGSRRSRLGSLLSGPGIGASTIRDSGDIDVHIVTHAADGSGPAPPVGAAALSRRRRIAGLRAGRRTAAIARAAARARRRHGCNLTSNVLAFLLAVIVVALVGGLWPAMLAAIGGSVLLNYFFTPPTADLQHRRDSTTPWRSAIFVLVAAMVSSVVDRAARRTRQAAHASAESETLATLAGIRAARRDRACPPCSNGSASPSG